MTEQAAPAGRILAEAIRGLPPGLVARAIAAEDVQDLTDLQRASDIAGSGRSSTNVDEVHDEISDPDCGWARGCATVWRGTELVGALIVFDGLASGRGWILDVYARPGDPRIHAINAALIDSALQEGRTRWEALPPAPDAVSPVAKSGCYSNDAALPADLVQRGFAEVRRFLTMRIDHGSAGDAPDTPIPADGAQPAPGACVIRPFVDVPAEWRALHEVSGTAFRDHFDFSPVDYDEWVRHFQGATLDLSQWLVAELDSQMVAYARGSNRYASQGFGYVASIGVLREHRGRGVARELLRARFADDASRGFLATVLHVDSDSPTGATRLYRSVGMVVDSEIVWFNRPLFDEP